MQARLGKTMRRCGAATACAVVLFGGSASFLAPSGADDQVAASDAALNKPESSEAPKSGKGWKNPMPAFTPEREAAAVTFVSTNHPELAPLLAGLKISRPSEYQKAIRKLFGDSERLAHSRENHPRRYELELQEWKLDSRAQLLVARLTMDRTPELEAQLRRILAEQFDVQRELLNLERERLTQRTAMLDKEIAKFEKNRDKQLDERFDRALNSAGQRKQSLKGNKGDGKPADSAGKDASKDTKSNASEPARAR
jgi:hypothetical protein